MKKFIVIFVSLLIATGLFTACGKKRPSTITVTGKSQISVPSDLLKIQVSAVTTDKTAERALSQNNDKMNKTIEILKKMGLDKKNVQTQSYSLNPVWKPRPNNPPEYWKSSIIGYTVENSILIKTKKLDMAGKIIENVIKSGSNKIDSVTFALDNQDKYKNEAIASGKSYAETMAKTGSVTLVGIKNMSLGGTYIRANNPRSYSNVMMKMDMAESAPQINPGQVKVEASVNITYLIKN